LKLSENVQNKNKIIQMVYGGQPLDAKAIFNEYKEYAKILKLLSAIPRY
jgi:hypothetical protein